MKKYFQVAMSALALTGAFSVNAQQTCDTTGNLIIFSNYDGGDLQIDVDVNIPNLRIGVCSYEFSRVTISGTYASNVIAVGYAGINSNNNNCNIATPYTSSFSGQPASATADIQVQPAVSYTNVNGATTMIGAYNCDTATDQGGLNTPDQVVHYFLQTLGGTFRFQRVQYGCWSGSPRAVSTGGNCCIVPALLPTGVTGSALPPVHTLAPRLVDGSLSVALPGTVSGQLLNITVFDAQGRLLHTESVAASATSWTHPGFEGYTGLLVVRATWADGSAVGRVVAVQ